MPVQLQGKTKGVRMISEIVSMHRKGISKAKIAAALNISRNTVRKYVAQLSKDDNVSFPSKKPYQAPWAGLVDWKDLRARINKGFQLAVIWEELTNSEHIELQKVPYVSFWREYRRRFPDYPIQLHKTHPPAERCEVDYKGDAKGLRYFDRSSNEYVQAKLFGSILCFSQLFYAQATVSEKQGDIFEGISRSFEYFGGVPATIAVDNPKTLVSKAHRYDPELNPEFSYFSEHYQCAPLAMRPRKPKDKNLIENVLGVFWRWAKPRFTERQFYSLGELNSFLRVCLDEFNRRTMRKYNQSRKERFELGEKDVLQKLPQQAYSFGIWKESRVHPDCHIQVEHNFYSVPYQLRGKNVSVRVSNRCLDIYSELERVAIHSQFPKCNRGRYLTNKKHLPEAHLAVSEFNVKRALQDAETVGVATYVIVSSLINNSMHPLRYLRRCQGILRLAKRYSPEQLERACEVLADLNITMPKLKELEAIVKTKHRSNLNQDQKINRKPNPNLRGQLSWRN